MQTLAPKALGTCGNCGGEVTTADDLTVLSVRRNDVPSQSRAGWERNYFHAEYVGCQQALAREDNINRWGLKAKVIA
jgi:hypothetical protein